jgi:hypothetical protein
LAEPQALKDLDEAGDANSEDKSTCEQYEVGAATAGSDNKSIGCVCVGEEEEEEPSKKEAMGAVESHLLDPIGAEKEKEPIDGKTISWIQRAKEIPELSYEQGAPLEGETWTKYVSRRMKEVHFTASWRSDAFKVFSEEYKMVRPTPRAGQPSGQSKKRKMLTPPSDCSPTPATPSSASGTTKPRRSSTSPKVRVRHAMPTKALEIVRKAKEQLLQNIVRVEMRLVQLNNERAEIDNKVQTYEEELKNLKLEVAALSDSISV